MVFDPLPCGACEITRTLWNNGSFSADDFVVVADTDPVPTDRPALVSLARWRTERDALSARNAAIGVVLPPDAEWSDIVPDLARFPVVAILRSGTVYES